MSKAEMRFRDDRGFYVGAAVVIAAVVFVGFAPSYFLKFHFNAPPPLTTLTRVHGAVFTAWILLFMIQTGLVAANRIEIHRSLGVVGVVLAAAMLGLGAATAYFAAKLGHAPPGGPPPLAFLLFPLGDVFVFASFFAAGILYRQRADVHKRLLLLAALSLTGVGFGRMAPLATLWGPLGAEYLCMILLLLGVAAYDSIRFGRIHAVYFWGTLLFIGTVIARFAVATTPRWLELATWLTS